MCAHLHMGGSGVALPTWTSVWKTLVRAPEFNSPLYPRHLDRVLVIPPTTAFTLGLLVLQVGSPCSDVFFGPPVAHGDS